MRIIYWVLGGIVIGLVVILAGSYGWEKAILAIAGYNLKQDVAKVRQLARKGTGSGTCESWSGYQLRFVSDQEYVLEPACGFEMGNDDKPTKRLFGGAKRLYGSGILVTGENDNGDAWVHLGFKDSQLVVGIIERKIKMSWEVEKFAIGGDSPAMASCANWGFSCCQPGKDVGEGDQVITYDCVLNCYQKCNQKPMVLRFNTNPLMNLTSRTLMLPRQDQSVEFGFDVNDDTPIEGIEIDYGDGTKDVGLKALTQNLVHTYNCQRSRCDYVVRLNATDVGGNELVESSLNTILVTVD